MKAYGVKRSDCMCCYGHYKFGARLKDRSRGLSISQKNSDRVRKKSARQAAKRDIRAEVQ